MGKVKIQQGLSSSLSVTPLLRAVREIRAGVEVRDHITWVGNLTNRGPVATGLVQGT